MSTAPRKPQDHRPKKTAAKKPDPSVSLDLKAVAEEFRREDEERGIEPFTFNHPTGQGTYTLPDPHDMDIVRVAEVSLNPMANITVLLEMLGEEQYEALKADGGLPVKYIPRLVEAWNKHYGVDADELGKSLG